VQREEEEALSFFRCVFFSTLCICVRAYYVWSFLVFWELESGEGVEMERKSVLFLALSKVIKKNFANVTQVQQISQATKWWHLKFRLGEGGGRTCVVLFDGATSLGTYPTSDNVTTPTQTYYHNNFHGCIHLHLSMHF
jgi:hypothetical protein